MAPFALKLFGPFEVRNQGTLCTGFDSDKSRALLAFLALNQERPQRRETLVGLLWPSVPEARARASLSQALHNLRTLFGKARASSSLLCSDAKSVQLPPNASLWIDVQAFARQVSGCPQHTPASQSACQSCLEALDKAVALYQADLLAGFSVRDAPAFEEWLLLTRETLRNQCLAACQRLTDGWIEQRNFAAALLVAHGWVQLDSTNEVAHLRLIQLLAQQGERAEALDQFAHYSRIMQVELGLPPSTEAQQLAEEIRSGSALARKILSPGLATTLPDFLQSPDSISAAEPPFVGRVDELTQLDAALTKTLAGIGQVLLVTGEAGMGKSALMRSFAHRAQAKYQQLVVITGNCNAHTGIGDPYLPFREALALLTGDVEARLRAGALTDTHAKQLWTLLPQTLAALLDAGPDLIGAFVPTKPLVDRVTVLGVPDLLTRLQALLAHRDNAPRHEAAPQQQALFEQVTKVLQTLARKQPILLILDDLQWADIGTISLLFHLGHCLAQDAILIVGAYRTSDVAAGRNGQRHPLEIVLHELQRQYGAIDVALEASDGRHFVEALVDREPNRLPAAFRDTLWAYTEGNALFTVELLRGMQERGELILDESGRWVPSASLDWEQLPARVEAVIGERIGRLPRAQQDLLATASVEGEVFTAEVAAGVQGIARREAVHWLSSELDRQHQLVRLHTLEHLGEQPITRYRFRHILFQKYLYTRLDPAERRYLHADVGAALEELYSDQSAALGPVAGALARHFEEAWQWQKAAGYLLQAGQQALQLSALAEAIAQFNQGIGLLQRLAEQPEALQLELQFQLALGVALTANQGYNATAADHCYRRAEELCHKLGDATQLFIALRGRCVYLQMSAQLEASLLLCERLIQIGDTQRDPWFQVEAHSNMGATLYWLGDYAHAREHLEVSTTIAVTLEERNIALQFPQDSRVLTYAYRAYVLWGCGYPDQAVQTIEEAIALARRLDHANSLALAVQFATYVHLVRREVQQARFRNAELLHLAERKELAFWVDWAYTFQSWFLLEQGRPGEALDSLRAVFPGGPSQWNTHLATWPLALFALAHAQNLSYETALTAIQVAIDQANALHEQSWLPELHRLRGKFLLLQDEHSDANRSEAEGCFEQAIVIARRQGSKAWELRAATSLAKLWQRQGKRAEAHDLLAPIYGWFTEGFDTYDLQKVRQVLQSLSG